MWQSVIVTVHEITKLFLKSDHLPVTYWVIFDFQLLRLDYDVNSNADPVGNPNVIIGTIFMLFFDGVFYLMLTFYFEKVLPSKLFQDKT